jgi:citrate lyase subunit beta/citryl-CoA lyase
MKTWLFVPGSESEKVRKALASAADVVIVDWEDAVASSQKEHAREVTRAILAQNHARARVVLRINSFRSAEYADDIAALSDLPVSAIMLAKVSHPEEVQQLATLGRPIIPLIESAFGIENAYQIAKAHPLVERLVLGTMDLMADLGSQWEPDGPSFQYLRSRVLVAGRAAGLAGSIDGVYPLLGDLDGLHREAMTARKLGFVGKLVIHPRQIEVVRRVFSPTAEEIEDARQTIAAFGEAVAAGRSAIRIGERFIDPPMVLWAQNTLRMADVKARNHTTGDGERATA